MRSVKMAIWTSGEPVSLGSRCHRLISSAFSSFVNAIGDDHPSRSE
jgi:hypothetical protein